MFPTPCFTLETLDNPQPCFNLMKSFTNVHPHKEFQRFHPEVHGLKQLRNNQARSSGGTKFLVGPAAQVAESPASHMKEKPES
jgi:hypothetical protein